MIERSLKKTNSFSLFNREYLTKDKRLMIQLEQLMEKHMHEGRTADFYAEQLDMSFYRLNSLVKKQFKLSLPEYLRSKKHEEAYLLLQETDLSLKEISAKVGFAELSCFTKAFKALEGMSPKAYRLSYKAAVSAQG